MHSYNFAILILTGFYVTVVYYLKKIMPDFCAAPNGFGFLSGKTLCVTTYEIFALPSDLQNELIRYEEVPL